VCEPEESSPIVKVMAPRPGSGASEEKLVLSEMVAALPLAGPVTELLSPVRRCEGGKTGLRISRMAL
jgi:hypothetical protein